LIVGAGTAAAVKSWRVLAVPTLVVAFGLFYAVRHLQGGDDQTGVLLVIAAFTNFVGWIVGLLIGTLTTRLRSPRPASGD
jgi:ABC-type Fe3+ transport system permease subunit